MNAVATQRDPARAVAWMGGAQLFFAWMGIFARIGGRSVPWPEVGAARFFMGAITAYLVARLRGRSLRVTRVRDAWVRSGFGTLSACGTFFVYATPGLAIGDAVTLLATSPIFVALLSAPLLGEKLRASVGVALLIGFCGIAVVAQPSFASAGHVVASGAGAAMASAMAMIWLRRIGPTESSEAIVLHLSLVGFAFMLLASLAVWKTPTGADAVALALTGLSGGLAQIAMTRAYSLDYAARVSVMSFASVVFMRLLAVPIFHEVPTYTQVAGSVLVIASGIVLARGQGAKPSLSGRLAG